MKTNNRQSLNTYYVASLARYVLVQPGSPDEARAKGEQKLERPAHVVRLNQQPARPDTAPAVFEEKCRAMPP
jgi:hypothetical protein